MVFWTNSYMVSDHIAAQVLNDIRNTIGVKNCFNAAGLRCKPFCAKESPKVQFLSLNYLTAAKFKTKVE